AELFERRQARVWDKYDADRARINARQEELYAEQVASYLDRRKELEAAMRTVRDGQTDAVRRMRLAVRKGEGFERAFRHLRMSLRIIADLQKALADGADI